MSSTSDIARACFAALSARDLDGALALWRPGASGRFGGRELLAPHGLREHLSALLASFPDLRVEVLELTTYRNRSAARWRATGTFAGPASFHGFAPTGARIAIEGCGVVRVENGLIAGGDLYLDSGELARQLGLLPQPGSAAARALTGAVNAATRLRGRLRGASEPEQIAAGVWLVRGGFPARTMNVYLLEEEDGVTVFDAGIAAMAPSLASAAARLGVARRVVLGHADADHRGAAAGLRAPVYCHELEREAAQSASPWREYWNLDLLDPHGRLLLGRLIPIWDGGALEVAGTVVEGDRIAGFEVIELPGHAPGLIGLFRESDRLALVSDALYTLDPQTGLKRPARVPHPAFNLDTDQARRSIRKLAELDPSIAWPGHADPVAGDVRAQLERAAATL
jgi:hydroxyacylglutathione hydrolase